MSSIWQGSFNYQFEIRTRASHTPGILTLWDAGKTPRTGEWRVNSYLIVYQKWRNWIQQTAEWGHCYRGLVLVDFKPVVTVPSLRGLLCSISSLLIDNQISVHSSLTRSCCSNRVPSDRIPGKNDMLTKMLSPVYFVFYVHVGVFSQNISQM